LNGVSEGHKIREVCAEEQHFRKFQRAVKQNKKIEFFEVEEVRYNGGDAFEKAPRYITKNTLADRCYADKIKIAHKSGLPTSVMENCRT
jgi:hypothetical protein